MASQIAGWWFAPQPRGRIVWLRAFAYLFVIADVLLITTSPVALAGAGDGLYQPLFAARVLHLPEPSELLITMLRSGIVGAALFALWGRWPRSSGATVFALYLLWMFAAFSYGKVDHDRFSILVALAVLPTVGRAAWGEQGSDDASGWALRCIQVAVVATYFLAAWAKLRFGGIEWLNGATLLRGVMRRGTPLAAPLIDRPAVLALAQHGIMAFELLSPLALVHRVPRRIFLGGAALFHLVTYATIAISFLPHLVCLLAFAPLERLSAARFEGTTRSTWVRYGSQRSREEGTWP